MIRSARSNLRRPLTAVVLAAGVVVLGLPQAAADSRASSVRKGATITTAPPAIGQHPTVSGDGRTVVFAGSAPSPADVVPNPTGEPTVRSTIWVLDRFTGQRTELTPLGSGMRSGHSVLPVISADGCRVAIVTELPLDLFRDDDKGTRWDAYVATLPTCGGESGSWELVSAGLDGGGASDTVVPTSPPAISASGAVVAYTSQFSVSLPDMSVVRVVDLTLPPGDPGRSRMVAGTPSEAPNTTFRYIGSRDPSLSADGSVLTFTSDADAHLAVPGWGSGPKPGGFARSHVYAWDRFSADDVSLVSAGPDGTADGEASASAVSPNGRFVVFVSSSTNLVSGVELPPCLEACVAQVYRFDRLDGTTVIVSAVDNVAANAPATQPAITEDGGEVVFITRASNLFAAKSPAGGGPTDGDVVVADLATGVLTRVSLLPDGVSPTPASQSSPAISGSGRVVVFDTAAGAAFGGAATPARQIATVTRAPSLALADLDVGTVAVGFPGPEWYVSVLNSGPSAFMPVTIESSNPDFAITGGTCESQLPVPPGGFCTVNVMMTPGTPGPREGTITVSEEGFEAVSISTTVVGAGGEPTLAPNPAGGDFGRLFVGQASEPQVFTIENVGFSTVPVRSVAVRGAHPDDFTIETTTCRGASLELLGTCTVDVVFTPTGAGHRTAIVVIGDSSGQYTSVLVNGDGVHLPRLAVDESVVQAGSRLTVTGAGFAPNTNVTVVWADGVGRRTAVVTDANGGFMVTILLGLGERPGDRRLVAMAAPGDTATVDLTVLPAATQRGPGSPTWPNK